MRSQLAAAQSQVSSVTADLEQSRVRSILHIQLQVCYA